MQTFYNQLVSQPETLTPLLTWLKRLTQADLAALTALQNNLAWFEWGAEDN